MPVLDHLNSQARLALTRAEAVAHGLAHHYVGTEHLLVGLARVPGCAAELALARCGLDGDEVASGLEQLLGRGPHALAVTPPHTAAVELVLARSRWEARALGEDVVTMVDLHHVEVEDVLVARSGCGPGDACLVGEEVVVEGCGGAALVVPLGEAGELGREHHRLDGVEPGVPADVFVVVLLDAAVVAQLPDGGVERGIVAEHRPGVPGCAEVLARVEARRRGEAVRADPVTVPTGPVGLGCVLEDDDVCPHCVAEPFDEGHLAVEMHR